MIRKNIRMVIAAAAIALAAFPVSTTRADALNWDAHYTMPELGIQFSYPSDWTLTEVEGGITISADEADVAPQLDDDPETIPAGYVITVLRFDGVTEGATLDEVVDSMVEQLSFSELVREEVGIVSHRTIMIGGYSSRGRLVQANFMLVGTTLYQFAVSAPEDDDVGGLWGDWMVTFLPVDAAPLGDTIQAPISKLSLQHPAGWSTAAELPNTYFENAADLKNPAQPIGVIVSLVEMDITGLDMELDNVLALAYQTQGWDAANIPAAQHIVEYEPAYVIKGESVSAPGFYGIIAALKVGDAAVLVVSVAPSEAQLTAFEPTFYAMLMSATVE